MNRYKSGARKEYAVLRAWRACGASCARSAGSHGLWDISVVHDGYVFLIQVKAGRKHEDANLALFRKLKVRENVRKQLYHYTRGQTKPRIEEL